MPGFLRSFVFDIICPRVEIPDYPENRVPVGSTYTLKFRNFPPNAQLIAPRNLSVPGGDMVNLGWTDSTGTLELKGIIARGPPGTYYIIAWNAIDGKYCAVTTLFVV